MIYLSGLVTKDTVAVVKVMDFQHIMPSFWYPIGLTAMSHSRHSIVDSGAHTIQEHGSIDDGKLEEHFWKYVEFVETCEFPAVWVELDVEDAGIDLDRIDSMYDRLRETGKPILRVWHTQRGEPTWVDYCESGEHEILGLSLLDGIPLPYIRKLVRIAHQNGVRVHGFGCSTPRIWAEVPFYSMDASSWRVGSLQYGTLRFFDPSRGKNTLIKYLTTNPDTRELVLNETIDPEHAQWLRAERHRLNTQEGKDEAVVMLTAQAREYLRTADYYHALWTDRGIDLWSNVPRGTLAL